MHPTQRASAAESNYSNLSDSNNGNDGAASSSGTAALSGYNNMSFAGAQRAFESHTDALHKKLNLVYISLLGFVVIGLCALGCVTFGVVEIIGGDKVFENEGFGEVLTVLGTYFSIPYVFMIILFLIVTIDNKATRFFGSFVRRHNKMLIVAGLCGLYIFQCAIMDLYMARLTNNYAAIVVIFDVVGLAMIVFFYNADARGFIFGFFMFSIKCAVIWGQAYKTVDAKDFWGPNGILSMLFLAIPMCELPLMASYVRGPDSPHAIAGALVGERNTLLDGGADGGGYYPPKSGGAGDLYSPSNDGGGAGGLATATGDHNAVVDGGATAKGKRSASSSNKKKKGGDSHTTAVDVTSSSVLQPQQSNYRFSGISNRLIQMAEMDFVNHFVSHFGLYLNHVMHTVDLITLFGFAFTAPTTNEKQREAPLPFRVLIAILFCLGFFVNHATILHLFYNREDVHSSNIPFIQPIIRAANRTMRADGRADNDLDPKASYQRRLFQYMLLMVAVVDVPLLICRLELWAGQYEALSIFVAKNIKDICDVAMLTSRVNENIRQNESLIGGQQQQQPQQGGGGASLVPPMREQSL